MISICPNQQPQKKTLPLAQVGQTIPSATVNIYHSQDSGESHLDTSNTQLTKPALDRDRGIKIIFLCCFQGVPTVTEDQPTKGFRCLDSIRLNRWQKIQYCPGGLEPNGNCGVRGLFLCKVMGGYRKWDKGCWGLLASTVGFYIVGLVTYLWMIQQTPALDEYPQWDLAKDHPWWKWVNQTVRTHIPQGDCLVCAGPRVPTKPLLATPVPCDIDHCDKEFRETEGWKRQD